MILSLSQQVDRMREQADRLLRLAGDFKAAGEAQLEAARKLETAVAFMMRDAIPSPPAASVPKPGKWNREAFPNGSADVIAVSPDGTVMAFEAKRRPEYTVADVAASILFEAGALERNELFERVCHRGAKPSNVASMVSLLGQDKQRRFVSMGGGFWELSPDAKADMMSPKTSSDLPVKNGATSEAPT